MLKINAKKMKKKVLGYAIWGNDYRRKESGTVKKQNKLIFAIYSSVPWNLCLRKVLRCIVRGVYFAAFLI